MTMEQTPEQRRDERVADLVVAGLVVTGEVPLARPDEPHTVVAYRLSVLDPTNRTRARLQEQEAATRLDEDDLIEWTPAPEPEILPELPEEMEGGE
jgi:hypothetical protein